MGNMYVCMYVWVMGKCCNVVIDLAQQQQYCSFVEKAVCFLWSSRLPGCMVLICFILYNDFLTMIAHMVLNRAIIFLMSQLTYDLPYCSIFIAFPLYTCIRWDIVLACDCTA